MGTDLDDILNDDTTETPEPVEQQPETIGQPRDEQGRFAPVETGEEQPETPPVEESAPPAPQQEQSHVPFAALKDERTKRQELEAQVRQYEQFFAQLQAQEQTQPQNELDPQTQAFVDLVRDQVKQQIMSEVQQAGSQFAGTTKLEVSEMLARRQYEDYDQTIEQGFKEAVTANPFLAQQVQADKDPAGAAYRIGKQFLEAKSYGSQPTREQMEAEIREKLIAELGLSNRPQAPSTLASERSVGSRSGPAWTGPKPLGDILGS